MAAAVPSVEASSTTITSSNAQSGNVWRCRNWFKIISRVLNTGMMMASLGVEVARDMGLGRKPSGIRQPYKIALFMVLRDPVPS